MFAMGRLTSTVRAWPGTVLNVDGRAINFPLEDDVLIWTTTR
jgi:hypothetical protein